VQPEPDLGFLELAEIAICRIQARIQDRKSTRLNSSHISLRL
jgi:hypothetical protein